MSEQKTVVLCGSVTRATAALDAAEAHYLALGYRVHKPVRDDSLTPQEHAERWYALIRDADLVVHVMDATGYRGQQSQYEMAVARVHNRRCDWWRGTDPRPEGVRQPVYETHAVQLTDSADWDVIARWCGGTVEQQRGWDDEYTAWISIPRADDWPPMLAHEGWWVVLNEAGGVEVMDDQMIRAHWPALLTEERAS